MKIETIVSPALDENGYIVYEKIGGECYIIDPDADARLFLSFLDKNRLTLKGVWLTHNHWDHVGAVSAIVKATGCRAYMHKNDAASYSEPVEKLRDGDTFRLGDSTFTVRLTQGHTRGSVCFVDEEDKIAFTGDTIFDTDLGRTDLPESDPRKMVASLQNVVSKWPDDLTIYPGHDSCQTMAFVRKYNTEFNEALEIKL